MLRVAEAVPKAKGFVDPLSPIFLRLAMSIADRQGPMGVSANWLRTRSGHYALVPWAVLIMLLDVARIFLLPQSYQSAFTDIFEVAVVGFGAIPCALAAARA